MSSPGSTEALTPNHFLKLKTKVVLSPPGVFKSTDLYARKWWRQVQHLTNEFCCRWKKEFPLPLQERQKWTHTRKNLQVNDVLIIKDDDTPWNQWKVCHVIKALPDKDGLVSKVKLEVGSWYLPFNRKKIRHCQLWKDQSSSWCYYRRHKMTKDQGIPVKEPSWDKHIKT